MEAWRAAPGPADLSRLVAIPTLMSPRKGHPRSEDGAAVAAAVAVPPDSPVPGEGSERSVDPRPGPGEVLSGLPAWPREWAQRLGREARGLGARVEVHRSREGNAWELRWVIDRRSLLVLRPVAQGVRAELSIPERALPHILEHHLTDEEFRQKLLAAAPLRGRRRMDVALDNARRVNTISGVLILLSRLGPG